MQKYELFTPSESDAAAISGIEEACFALPLSEQQILSQIRDEKYILVCAGNRQSGIAAYAGMYSVLDEGYITNVAVSPSFRREHIADRLMEELERLSVVKELSFLTLEVRESNSPAILLYKKHGFLPAGLRMNYYQSPVENALIMTKMLSEGKN